ncbi:MAG: hypothetical protein ACOCXM_08030 [Myxococcota bacterium]
MDEWEEGARSFRPRSRFVWIAVGLNALLAAVFLGWPFAFGLWRATEGRDDFARFAACLWGGEPAADPGLGLPPDEALHFADRMLHGPGDWPGRCRPLLGEVRPRPAWLLLPSVKQAESIVADEVGKVKEELARVSDVRRSTRLPPQVPMKLHATVERLQAALSNQASVTGADLDLTEPAIRLTRGTPLVRPTRIPLRTARDGEVHLRARGDGILALAMDDRRIARAKVGGGGMTFQQVRRPPRVRATLEGPRGRPWLVSAMPEARCASDEPDRCAGRATGVARLGAEHARAPDPTWLAAHPEPPPDTTVEVSAATGGHAIHVVARGLEGDAEVRRFALAREDTTDKGPPADPVTPQATWPLRGFRPGEAVRLVQGATTHVLWTAPTPSGAVLRMRDLEPEPGSASEVHEAREIAGAGSPRMVTCTSGPVVWVLIGSGDRGRVVRFGDEAPVRKGASFELPWNPRRAPALACGEDRATVVAPTRHGLTLRRCDEEGRCEATRPIRGEVHTFAAIRDRGTTAVAFAAAPRRQVWIATWSDDESEPTSPRVVAPCFGEEGGLCGTPRFAARSGRILLAAREDGDLLVVETTDGGATWRPMRGLR